MYSPIQIPRRYRVGDDRGVESFYEVKLWTNLCNNVIFCEAPPVGDEGISRFPAKKRD